MGLSDEVIGFGKQIQDAFAKIVPDEADPDAVAHAVATVVDTPFGQRPFRVHIDPSDDGASVAFAVIDRIRNEMLHRVGFADLLKPRIAVRDSRRASESLELAEPPRHLVPSRES